MFSGTQVANSLDSVPGPTSGRNHKTAQNNTNNINAM